MQVSRSVPPAQTALALWRLARPMGSVLLWIVPLTGYGFAHWDYALSATRPLALLLVLVAWFSLSAATLWLNAALDGEEGEALFATAARIPAHVTAYGYIGLACAVAIASAADPRAGIACFAASLLSIAYSHPKTRWKASPVLGPLVNVLGYGILSWLAGWSVVRVPMTLCTASAMMLMATFALGMAFGAQAYQRNDDARRGYRTFVVTHGPAACLRVAIWCARISVAGVAVFAALRVYPRLCVFGVPVFVFAEMAMARWRAAPNGGTPAHAALFAVRMLAGGVVLVALAVAASYLPAQSVFAPP